MSKISKIFSYVLEFTLAIVFISIDLKWFLVYAFMNILFALDIKTDYLRKVVRVFQVANEIKLISIQKKLNVSESYGEKIKEEMFGAMTEEQQKRLLRDFRDIQG